MNAVKKIARPGFIIAFFLVCAACIVCFVILFAALRTQGVPTTLDMMPGFSYDEARAHLALYTTAAKSLLNWFQLVDLVFPFAYGLFLSSIITCLLVNIDSKDTKAIWLNLLPFAAAAFDLLENAGIFAMARIHPAPYPVVALLASAANAIKFLFTGVSLITLVVLIWFRLRSIFKKNKSAGI
jgi:hypothetical protein